MASKADIKAGQAYVSIYADQSKLERGLAKAQARLRAWGASVTQYGRSLMLASAVVLAPTAYGMKLLVSYDDQMRELRAVTRTASKDAAGAKKEFAALDRTVRRLGRSTSYTATEVAQAATELGRAGFYPAEIDDTIEAVLNLGKATRTELGPTATVMADTLRAFKLSATEAANVADIMLATTTNSTQGLSDLAEAMKYAAPAAKAAGATVKETAAAIGVLANVGVKGSMAGTSLRIAYQNLVDPGVVKQLRGMGIATADASGNLRPVTAIIADIGKATAKLGSAKRLAIFSQLFGARGMGAALELSQPGVFAAFIRQLDKIAGAAAKASQEMEAGPGGAWRRLLSASESAFLSLAKALEKPFVSLVEWLTKAIGRIEAWILHNREFVVLIVKTAAAVFAFGAALVAVGVAFKVAAFAIGTFKTAVSAIVISIRAFKFFAGALLQIATVLFSPFGIGVLVIAALAAVLMKTTTIGKEFASGMMRAFGMIGQTFKSMWKGIVSAIMVGDLALAGKIAWAGIKVSWLAGILPLRELWNTFVVGIVDLWAKAGTSLVKSWEDLKYVWAGFINVIWKAWLGFGFLVDNLFWGIVRTVIESLQTVARSVGNLMNNVPGLSIVGTQLIKFADSDASGNAKAQQQAYAKKYLDELDKADANMERKRQSYIDALDALDAEEKASSAARWKESDDRLQGMRDKLAAAKKELDAAVADAAKKRQDAAVEAELASFFDFDKMPRPKNGPPVPDMSAISTQIANATSKGAFDLSGGNLFALQSGGATSDAATRTADNTKRTADEVDELNGKLDRALQFG